MHDVCSGASAVAVAPRSFYVASRSRRSMFEHTHLSSVPPMRSDLRSIASEVRIRIHMRSMAWSSVGIRRLTISISRTSRDRRYLEFVTLTSTVHGCRPHVRACAGELVGVTMSSGKSCACQHLLASRRLYLEIWRNLRNVHVCVEGVLIVGDSAAHAMADLQAIRTASIRIMYVGTVLMITCVCKFPYQSCSVHTRAAPRATRCGAYAYESQQFGLSRALADRRARDVPSTMRRGDP